MVIADGERNTYGGGEMSWLGFKICSYLLRRIIEWRGSISDRKMDKHVESRGSVFI